MIPASLSPIFIPDFVLSELPVLCPSITSAGNPAFILFVPVDVSIITCSKKRK